MSTAKFDTLSTLDGSQSVPVNTVAQGSAKAWVNFNGTGTVAIRASFNVSSITDNGTGDYTLNFTNAMVDANYSVQVTAGFQDTPASDYNNMSKVVQITTTTVRFKAGYYAAYEDKSYCGVTVFR